MCSGAGFNLADVAQLLHVSPRTVHNWFSGACAVPYSSWRLIRILGRYELPDKSWAGWLMHSGKLWTPEGHPIEPRDGAWWSLLVRQARSFRTQYSENTQLRAQLRLARLEADARRGDPARGESLRAKPLDHGLVPSFNNAETGKGTYDVNLISDCHHQNPWPLPYASHQTWKAALRATPPASACPSMPWSPSPWTPTCAPATTLQSNPATTRLVQIMLPQFQPCHPLRTLPQLPSQAHPRPPTGAPARPRKKHVADLEGGQP